MASCAFSALIASDSAVVNVDASGSNYDPIKRALSHSIPSIFHAAQNHPKVFMPLVNAFEVFTLVACAFSSSEKEEEGEEVSIGMIPIARIFVTDTVAAELSSSASSSSPSIEVVLEAMKAAQMDAAAGIMHWFGGDSTPQDGGFQRVFSS